MTDGAECDTAAPCGSDIRQQAAAPQAAAKQSNSVDSAGRSGAAASCIAADDSQAWQGSNEAPGAVAARTFEPETTAEYQLPQYWDARFAKEDSYEWCKVGARSC